MTIAPGEQIEKSREFVRRLWRLENEERPAFIISYVGPRVRGGRPVRSAIYSTAGKDTVRDRLQSAERFLSAQLEEIESQLVYRGDFVPALCPTVGVVAIPSAFGCEVVWWPNDFPSVRPLIGQSPSKVYDLPQPEVTDGELGRILDYTRYFIERTGGRLPIRMADIQGPLDNASLIFGHIQFLEALKTHPREVHHMLQLTTDLIIAFVAEQRRIVIGLGAEFVPSDFQPWMPDGFGLAVANDAAVLISPQMHDEFSVPYLNQIAEACGGVYLHSCGNWLHLLPSLEKVKNLRGLEFGASETSFAPVAERFGGQTVLACRVGLHRDIKFNGMADYVARILKAKKTNRGLFINVDITNGLIDETWPETDLEEIYGFLEAK
ncbi:MAG: uroporphyrinogen decarboxylase family protein [Acidobacteriota bacterium]